MPESPFTEIPRESLTRPRRPSEGKFLEAIAQSEPDRTYGMIGTSKPMRDVYDIIARAIHSTSRRGEHPFDTVDCSALAESLLESELFGHVKGAFTGAQTDKRG